MKRHISLSLAMVANLALSASAHTVFTTLFVDDVTQGDGTCVRMPMDPVQCTYPVDGVTSNDMACGKSPRQKA